MAHCTFGPGATSFGGIAQQIPPARDTTHDVQAALEQWVEKGIAPDYLVASKFADDKPTTRTVIATHLLCTYPEVAKYKGAGDPNDATTNAVRHRDFRFGSSSAVVRRPSDGSFSPR
jgi:feruloyl esterase